MAVAKKIDRFMSQASWIRRMFEEGLVLKARVGADKVFDFGLGNPNLEPPAEVEETLRQIVGEARTGSHAYMSNAGYEETRNAVASFLGAKHGLAFRGNNVVMTCGAGGALNVALKALLDPGDEVVIPSPHFAEYAFYVDNHGGIPRFVPGNEDFSLDLPAIAEAVTEKTKAVLLNTPNNPTGVVYSEEALRGLAAVLEEKSRALGRPVYVLADEPYSEIVYDGIEAPSIVGAYVHSVICTSYSKSLSLPGERIGYAAVHPAAEEADTIVAGMVLCNRILGFVNAPALMQRLIARLQGVRVDVAAYQRKRDLLCAGLASRGYRFVKPQGAFYLFPRSPIPDDVAFVRILQKKRILVVPGSGFGGPGHFRIAYCVPDETIVRALDGFGEALKEAG